MDAVKEKIKSTGDRSSILSLLTLAPVSLTLKQISEHFGVSEYSDAQALELKKSGIFEKPEA